jgi:hypothetical protein
MVEEKKNVENQLEVERREKEAEIKEILKQQETLLNEKEDILNKLSKTQQKILDIKKRQHHQDEAKVDRLSSLPPRPHPHQNRQNSSPPKDKQPQLNVQGVDGKKPSNDTFNPFKV